MSPTFWASRRRVVRKHYAKWSQSRQDRITRVMQAVHAEAFGMERETAKERVN
jgi:hypothetical protein